MVADQMFKDAMADGVTLSELEKLDIGARYAHMRQSAVGWILLGDRPFNGESLEV